VENLREALKQRPEACCALMLDTQGPEIHTLDHKDGKPIKLRKGQTLEICTNPDVEGE
jgi:pyruvate kinase